MRENGGKKNSRDEQIQKMRLQNPRNQEPKKMKHQCDEDPWDEMEPEDTEIENVINISNLSKRKFILVKFKGAKRNT